MADREPHAYGGGPVPPPYERDGAVPGWDRTGDGPASVPWRPAAAVAAAGVVVVAILLVLLALL